MSDWKKELELEKAIDRALELLEKRSNDDNRSDINDLAIALLGWLDELIMNSRRERDIALAAGYDKYPKGAANSEEQIAQARRHATKEICLHEFLKDLRSNLRLKVSTNQSAMKENHARITSGV